jgi:hypothetical protein
MLSIVLVENKRQCAASVLTGFGTGPFGVRFQAVTRVSSFLKTSRLPLMSTQSATQWIHRIFPGVKTSGGLKLTNHFHPVQSLRMSGAIPLLTAYVFMAWAGTALIFTCFKLIYRPTHRLK